MIYPGKASSVPGFIASAKAINPAFKPPFKLLLDVDLTAVKSFQIEGSLAKPTTLVLDKQGIVRWGYVGAQPADRPRIASVLAQLDKLPK